MSIVESQRRKIYLNHLPLHVPSAELICDIECNLEAAMLKFNFVNIPYTTVIKNKIDPTSEHAGHGYIHIALCDPGMYLV